MTAPDSLVQAYLGARPKSTAIHARARGVFAAQGATHFARIKAPFRPYITRADGAHKWDTDGHRYIDYVLGHGALILGHGHPAVVAAVAAQAHHGLHFGDPHELEVRWAEAIRELMPAAERIEFTASGQEANQLGLRLARAFTGRKRLVKFAHNYHGWADELAALGSPGALGDYVTVLPVDDLDRVEETLRGRDVAMILIEGGGGRVSGRVPTSPAFFCALPGLAARYGTLVMLDEVVTGFREAAGGWQSVIGMKPDLTSIGKAASGGVASGAVLGRADVLACFDPASGPTKTVVHGGTWNAVPLACAAGIAACEVYRGSAPQRQASALAAQLRDQANQRFQERGLPARLYGRSILHIYLGPLDDQPNGMPTDSVDRLMDPALTPRYQRLDLHLLTRGIASLRGEALALSSAHTEVDVAATVTALAEGVAAMVEEGTLPAPARSLR